MASRRKQQQAKHDPVRAAAAARLGKVIDARIKELGFRYADFAKMADYSVAGLTNLREGTIPHDAMHARLELALAWAPGSIDAVVDGRAPTPHPDYVPGRQWRPKRPEPIAPAPPPVAHVAAASGDIEAALDIVMKRLATIEARLSAGRL